MSSQQSSNQCKRPFLGIEQPRIKKLKSMDVVSVNISRVLQKKLNQMEKRPFEEEKENTIAVKKFKNGRAKLKIPKINKGNDSNFTQSCKVLAINATKEITSNTINEVDKVEKEIKKPIPQVEKSQNPIDQISIKPAIPVPSPKFNLLQINKFAHLREDSVLQGQVQRGSMPRELHAAPSQRAAYFYCKKGNVQMTCKTKISPEFQYSLSGPVREKYSNELAKNRMIESKSRFKASEEHWKLILSAYIAKYLNAYKDPKEEYEQVVRAQLLLCNETRILSNEQCDLFLNIFKANPNIEEFETILRTKPTPSFPIHHQFEEWKHYYLKLMKIGLFFTIMLLYLGFLFLMISFFKPNPTNSRYVPMDIDMMS